MCESGCREIDKTIHAEICSNTNICNFDNHQKKKSGFQTGCHQLPNILTRFKFINFDLHENKTLLGSISKLCVKVTTSSVWKTCVRYRRKKNRESIEVHACQTLVTTDRMPQSWPQNEKGRDQVYSTEYLGKYSIPAVIWVYSPSASHTSVIHRAKQIYGDFNTKCLHCQISPEKFLTA